MWFTIPMGRGKDIAIIAGVVIVVVIAGLVGLVVIYSIDDYDFEPEMELDFTPDIKLAEARAYYYEDDDRLLVVVLFTDENGDYGKINGNADLTILKNDVIVHTDSIIEFSKDDFLTWQTNLGAKQTGFRIDIDKYFSEGKYQVSIDLNTKGGIWKDLGTSFRSFD